MMDLTSVANRLLGGCNPPCGRSPFVDRQETVVQCDRQKRHRRAVGRPLRTAEAAVRLLRLLELTNDQFVPFFPGLDVSLKEGLGLVVAFVLGVAHTGREFDPFPQIAQRRLVLR